MNLISLYSIPIWQSEYPEFEENKELFLNIAEKYKQETPKKNLSTNVHGYQSIETLHQVSELSSLFQYICDMCFKSTMDLDFVECDIALTSAWLNVNDSRQCKNLKHIHKDTFSGVFYLKVPDKSGNLIFENCAVNPMWNGLNLCSQKNQFTASTVNIDPIEGNIILFPSYLPHLVENNEHDEERISISFNLIALPKGYINYPDKNTMCDIEKT